MRFSDSVKAVQIRTYQLALEKLEDRLTPGETLGAALPLSSFICPYLALLGADVMRQDAPAPVVNSTIVADAAPQAPAVQAAAAPAAPVAVSDDAGSITVSEPVKDAVANPPMDDSADIQATPLTPSSSELVANTDPASDTLTADPSTLDVSTQADVSVHAPLTQNDAGAMLNGNTLMGASGGGLVITPNGSAVSNVVTSAPTTTVNLDAAGAAAAAAADTASPMMVGAHPTAAPGSSKPLDWNGSPNPPFTPAQIRHAYGFDLVSNQGAGQTIYIVDAYNDPNIASDLQTFDAKFGLSNPTLTVHKMSSRLRNSASWGLEESLDVEWAHAIAPQANITLVEATSNSNSNLYAAIDWATNNGAHVVSMSWGGGDASGESSNDSHFNHTGVSYVASSGDSGGVVEYPAASPYVLSVGGTHLVLNSSGNYSSESAWSSGGGGASHYESEPGYQTAFGISLSGRGTPDVSYDADPNTGVYVYDSYYNPPGWYEVGGTSAAAPQWAAMIALANQSRSTPLSTNNLTSRTEYNGATGSLYGTNYHDITSGSNGYSAGPGYDLATGIGTPQANNLVGWLINNN
jgi:subtilase family serine protease